MERNHKKIFDKKQKRIHSTMSVSFFISYCYLFVDNLECVLHTNLTTPTAVVVAIVFDRLG